MASRHLRRVKRAHPPRVQRERRPAGSLVWNVRNYTIRGVVPIVTPMMRETARKISAALAKDTIHLQLQRVAAPRLSGLDIRVKGIDIEAVPSLVEGAIRVTLNIDRIAVYSMKRVPPEGVRVLRIPVDRLILHEALETAMSNLTEFERSLLEAPVLITRDVLFTTEQLEGG